MKNMLIGGIGNVLLGDDGIGPYIARLLNAYYQFEEGVEIADLGTPAFDLIDQISGKDAVILIDSIKADVEPGSVLLYRKAEIVCTRPPVRVSPHSPALIETILSADMFGIGPRDLLLVGIVGKTYDSSCSLSALVTASIPQAIAEIFGELERLGVAYRAREHPAQAEIWWATFEKTAVPPVFRP